MLVGAPAAVRIRKLNVSCLNSTPLLGVCPVQPYRYLCICQRPPTHALTIRHERSQLCRGLLHRPCSLHSPILRQDHPGPQIPSPPRPVHSTLHSRSLPFLPSPPLPFPCLPLPTPSFPSPFPLPSPPPPFLPLPLPLPSLIPCPPHSSLHGSLELRITWPPRTRKARLPHERHQAEVLRIWGAHHEVTCC